MTFLFTAADPSFTLPALVCLIYSPLERVHSLASGTLIALLKNYKHNPDVICLLLDCLRYNEILLIVDDKSLSEKHETGVILHSLYVTSYLSVQQTLREPRHM